MRASYNNNYQAYQSCALKSIQELEILISLLENRPTLNKYSSNLLKVAKKY